MARNMPSEKFRAAAGDAKDALFVLFALLAAGLFCLFILFGGLGVGVPAFVFSFYLLTFWYLPRRRRLLRADTVLTFVPVVLLSLCFVLFDNSLLRTCNLLALLMLIPLNLTYVAGANEYRFFCAGSLWDVLKAVAVFPFCNLGKGVSALSTTARNSPRGSKAFKVAAGILLMTPVLLMILWLLVSSDETFQRMVYSTGSLLQSGPWAPIFGLLAAVAISFPLYSFFYSLHKMSPRLCVRKYRVSQRIRRIDPIYLNSGLWVVCIVYFLYIGIQLGYFFSAFRSLLPFSFTYAAYARRGFFELTAGSFLNLLLILFSITVSRKENGRFERGTRSTATALSLLTIMLIATAMSKLYMYIHFYGLTLNRVYASWFMLVLLCLFVLAIVKVHVRRLRLFRASAVVFTALYLALNFFNVDSFVSAYNISHLNARGKVDIVVFYELSDSMVPNAAKLIENPSYSRQIRDLLRARGESLGHSQWQDFCLSREAALKTVRSLGLTQ